MLVVIGYAVVAIVIVTAAMGGCCGIGGGNCRPHCACVLWSLAQYEAGGGLKKKNEGLT